MADGKSLLADRGHLGPAGALRRDRTPLGIVQDRLEGQSWCAGVNGVPGAGPLYDSGAAVAWFHTGQGSAVAAVQDNEECGHAEFIGEGSELRQCRRLQVVGSGAGQCDQPCSQNAVDSAKVPRIQAAGGPLQADALRKGVRHRPRRGHLLPARTGPGRRGRCEPFRQVSCELSTAHRDGRSWGVPLPATEAASDCGGRRPVVGQHTCRGDPQRQASLDRFHPTFRRSGMRLPSGSSFGEAQEAEPCRQRREVLWLVLSGTNSLVRVTSSFLLRLRIQAE